jgi:XRE family transcriptional regulator, master regulator for biofilm formation
MSPKRIGTMLRRLRRITGLNQEELARKARVSQPYLSQLEAGTYKNPSIEILQRLAKALGVPVTALL